VKEENTEFISILSESVDRFFLKHCIGHVSDAYDIDVEVLEKRIHFVFVPDPESDTEILSERILSNKEVISEIRELLRGKPNPILDFWSVTETELALAKVLGIPLWGQCKEAYLAESKSVSREIFKSLNVNVATGEEHIYSVSDAQAALVRMTSKTSASRFLIKTNSELGGVGIASIDKHYVNSTLSNFSENLKIPKHIRPADFEKSISLGGAVVEEFIEADQVFFPSVQLEILPSGAVRNVSTTEQIMDGCFFIGSMFPANLVYRRRLIELGTIVANYLSAIGARGCLSVDFLATKETNSKRWSLYALEINIRKSATTHACWWAKWLTRAEYNDQTGSLNASTGEILHLTRSVTNPALRTVAPKTLLKSISNAGLAFDHKTQAGVFVHMVGTLPKYGKFSATIIGHDLQELEDLSSSLDQLVDDPINRISDL